MACEEYEVTSDLDPFEEDDFIKKIADFAAENWKIKQIIQEYDKEEDTYNYVTILYRESDGITKYTGSGTHRERPRRNKVENSSEEEEE